MVEASLSTALARRSQGAGCTRRSGGKPGTYPAVRFSAMRRPAVLAFSLFAIAASLPAEVRECLPRMAGCEQHAGRAGSSCQRSERAAGCRRSRPATCPKTQPAHDSGNCRLHPTHRSSASLLRRRSRHRSPRPCSSLSTPSTPPRPAALAGGRRGPSRRAPRRPLPRVRRARPRSRSEAPVPRLELQPEPGPQRGPRKIRHARKKTPRFVVRFRRRPGPGRPRRRLAGRAGCRPRSAPRESAPAAENGLLQAPRSRR